MKMAVKFAELNETMTADFEKTEQSFAVGVREMAVLHDGQNGATFFPAVSADGILSWTNDRELSNPEPVCIKGADGKDGAPGAKGDKGDKGDRGEQGIQGEPGAKGDKGDQGIQGIQGIQGVPGVAGKDGKDGKDGANGTDGYTPVKYVDYWTDADRSDIIAAVIDSLPVYGGETA